MCSLTHSLWSVHTSRLCQFTQNTYRHLSAAHGQTGLHTHTYTHHWIHASMAVSRVLVTAWAGACHPVHCQLYCECQRPCPSSPRPQLCSLHPSSSTTRNEHQSAAQKTPAPTG